MSLSDVTGTSAPAHSALHLTGIMLGDRLCQFRLAHSGFAHAHVALARRELRGAG
jgi:hypothetical protein